MAARIPRAIAPRIALSMLSVVPLLGVTGRAAPARLQDDDPRDRDVQKAWQKLDEDERQEVIDWFSAEVQWLDTFQMRLLKWVLKDPERPPLLWPEVGRAPLYDPVVHAPAQPIPRKWLPEDSKGLERFREKAFKKVPERLLDSAWTYDYATRELFRAKDFDDKERLFANALNGFPPNLDLAEALVERTLDDGAHQKVLRAFAHGYTDRDGNAYPGITLYDAWASSTEMEMPDVDSLGIIHDVLDDWDTWKAPVRKQSSLYETIGELFVAAHQYRGLRHALARAYLVGDAVLRDNYQPNLVRLHALWEINKSTPEELQKRLPDSENWADWLETTFERIDNDAVLWGAGTRRKATLEADGKRVRATLVRVMREFGALKPARGR